MTQEARFHWIAWNENDFLNYHPVKRVGSCVRMQTTCVNYLIRLNVQASNPLQSHDPPENRSMNPMD